MNTGRTKVMKMIKDTDEAERALLKKQVTRHVVQPTPKQSSMKNELTSKNTIGGDGSAKNNNSNRG